jgi:hypothetical protein
VRISDYESAIVASDLLREKVDRFCAGEIYAYPENPVAAPIIEKMPGRSDSIGQARSIMTAADEARGRGDAGGQELCGQVDQYEERSDVEGSEYKRFPPP